MGSLLKVIGSQFSISVYSGVIASAVFLSLGFLGGALRRYSVRSRRRIFLLGKLSSDPVFVTGEVRFPERAQPYLAGGDADSLLMTSAVVARFYSPRQVVHEYASATTGTRLESGFISVGGPVNNGTTGELLADNGSAVFLAATFEASELCLRGCTDGANGTPQLGSPNDKLRYSRVKSESIVVSDWGLLVRMKNPYDPSGKSTCWVVAGCGSWGCSGAAVTLARLVDGRGRLYRRVRRQMMRSDWSCVVVRVNVGNHAIHRVQPEVLARRSSWRVRGDRCLRILAA